MSSPIDVTCPKCFAEAGEVCVHDAPWGFHKARINSALDKGLSLPLYSRQVGIQEDSNGDAVTDSNCSYSLGNPTP